MKEDQFIKVNSTTWRELESLSGLIDKKGIKSLPSKDVKRFLHLFRQSSHHLAYARTHYAQSSLTVYLNALLGKCHSYVYAVNKVSPGNLLKYVTYEFPRLLKEYRLYILFSFGVFAAGMLVSMLMVLYSVDNASIFLPADMVNGVKSGQAGNGQWNYPLMSSYIMVNNITVSLRAFVFGITLGLGTMYVLFYNGAMLGSLTVLMYMYGDPVKYWSLILPHGVLELTAIFISGAAGLLVAKGLLLPGEHSRAHALIFATKKAISLIIGVVFMLVIAGIIEGFFTPLEISPIAKLSFAAASAAVLAAYFSIPYARKR